MKIFLAYALPPILAGAFAVAVFQIIDRLQIFYRKGDHTALSHNQKAA